MVNEVDISVLLGKTIKQIEVSQNVDGVDDYIEFYCSDNTVYKMYHERDCCEDVRIEDISGELEHLLLSPILMAEAVVTTSTEDLNESSTATWYKLATILGYVTIRWIGESNGYYSEDVNFVYMGIDTKDSIIERLHRIQTELKEYL